MKPHAFGRLTMFAVAGALLTLGAARCSDAPSALRSPFASSSRGESKSVQARAPITGAAEARAKIAMAKGAWAGELHRKAMDDVLADPRARKGAHQRDAAGTCAIAWRLLRKFGPEIDRHLSPAAKSQRARMPQDLERHLNCPIGAADIALGTSNTMSLFQDPAWALPPGVTGEYEQYGPALTSAYDGAATPDVVEANTWAAVSQAAANGLGQADLEYLSLMANISVSSAYQWYEVELAGGLPGGGGGVTPPPPSPMSLFRLNLFGRIGIADLGGAMMGSRGGPWWALGGGILASAVYWINQQ